MEALKAIHEDTFIELPQENKKLKGQPRYEITILSSSRDLAATIQISLQMGYPATKPPLIGIPPNSSHTKSPPSSPSATQTRNQVPHHLSDDSRRALKTRLKEQAKKLVGGDVFIHHLLEDVVTFLDDLLDKDDLERNSATLDMESKLKLSHLSKDVAESKEPRTYSEPKASMNAKSDHEINDTYRLQLLEEAMHERRVEEQRVIREKREQRRTYNLARELSQEKGPLSPRAASAAAATTASDLGDTDDRNITHLANSSALVSATERNCIAKGPSGCKVFVQIKNGALTCTKEYRFRVTSKSNRRAAYTDRPNPGLEKYLRGIRALEEDMKYVMRISSEHNNLITYYGLTHEAQGDMITIELSMEHAGHGSLAVLLAAVGKLDLFKVRDYVEQIATALKFLHNNNLYHRNLKPSNVFIDKKGRVLLSDYSITKRLSDLVASAYSQAESSKSSSPLFARKNGAVDCQSTQDDKVTGGKADIFMLGQLILELCTGEPPAVQNETSNPPSNKILVPEQGPDWLPQSVVSVIDLCLNAQAYSTTIQSVLESDFITDRSLTASKSTPPSSPPQIPSLQHPGPFQAFANEAAELSSSPPAAFHRAALPDLAQSRYHQDFEYIGKIGEGAFGTVVKVKNKLDKQAYAIKIIKLGSKHFEDNKKILREVTLLSRLNHERVVRYYQAWIEGGEGSEVWNTALDGFDEDDEDEEEEDDDDYDEDNDSYDDEQEHITFEYDRQDTVLRGDDLGIHFVDSDVAHDEAAMHSLHETPDESGDLFFEMQTTPTAAKKRNIDNVFHSSSNNNQWLDEDISSNNSDSLNNLLLSSGGRKAPTFLYIQMEYCEGNSLRELINKTDLNRQSETCWHLLRQILEGLCHIHQQGMIHRDLKPENIFLHRITADAPPDIKLGDFGLATSGETGKDGQTGIERSNISASRSFFDVDNSLNSGEVLTGDVGTAAYIAPEIRSIISDIGHSSGNSGSFANVLAKYGSAVDMYSLGILFFEMCYPPTHSRMERYEILKCLRSDKIKLPADFDDPTGNKSRVIRQLLEHDPARRPSARELLRSTLLPPKIEDESLQQILRSLVDPSTTHYAQVMETLWNPSPNNVDQGKRDLSYDIKTSYDSKNFNKGDIYERNMIRDEIQRQLQHIFTRHGAVAVSTPLLMPKGSNYKFESDSACFLDPTGVLVHLPHDYKVPFARLIARSGPRPLRRFHFGKVFRENLKGYHPWESPQCDFDIVCEDKDGIAPDIETLKVVTEIADHLLSDKSSDYLIRLNHTALLNFMIVTSGVEETQIEDVKVALRMASKELTPLRRERVVRKHLEKNSGVAATTMASMEPYVKMQGSAQEIRDKLLGEQRGLPQTEVRRALDQLVLIDKHLRMLGVLQKIRIDVGLAPGLDAFHDVFFQFCIEDDTRKNSDYRKKRNPHLASILAIGGRYEKTVQKFTITRAPLKIAVAGAQIATEKILQDRLALVSTKNWASKPWIDVLVHNPSADAWKSRAAHMSATFDIMGRLWAAGVRARPTTSQDDNFIRQPRGRKDQCSFVTTIRENHYERGFVKLRSINNGDYDDAEVAIETLPAIINQYIIQAKGRQRRASGSYGDNFVKPYSNPVTACSSDIIFPPNDKKMAQKNKRQMLASKIKRAEGLIPASLFKIEGGIRLWGVFFEDHSPFRDYSILPGSASLNDLIEKYPEHEEYFNLIQTKVSQEGEVNVSGRASLAAIANLVHGIPEVIFKPL
eukprot:UC4_evm3s219